jgi:N-acetylneuraminic acid mutarotase
MANGKIYVLGGSATSAANNLLPRWLDSLDTVEIYDPAVNTWSTGPAMLSLKSGLAGLSLNGKIYALGGLVGSIRLNTVEIFDPKANTWTEGTAMPTARGDLAADTVNGKIYAIGGDGTRNTVEIYDAGTNVWITGASVATGWYDFAASDANGLVYVVGGTDPSGALSSVEQYEPVVTLYVFVKN